MLTEKHETKQRNLLSFICKRVIFYSGYIIFYTQVTDEWNGEHSEMLIITYMYIFFNTNCSDLLYIRVLTRAKSNKQVRRTDLADIIE